MSNYFQGTDLKPYHLSVGAILFNKEGKIACHHFIDHPNLKGEVYILMRETIEEGETIEEALSRGLLEEFGAEGELITYVGSLLKPYKVRGVTVQKTTLYFLLSLTSIDETKRLEGDPESTSQIEWLDPEDLASRMKLNAAKLKAPDLDESEVITRAASLNLI
jgi:8-oxo-dGTP pyrophosphatase MutT (NUDIX family)